MGNLSRRTILMSPLGFAAAALGASAVPSAKPAARSLPQGATIVRSSFEHHMTYAAICNCALCRAAAAAGLPRPHVLRATGVS